MRIGLQQESPPVIGSSPTEVALSSCIIARGEPVTGFSREIFPENWARFRSSVAGYLGDLFGNVNVGIGARLSSKDSQSKLHRRRDDLKK